MDPESKIRSCPAGKICSVNQTRQLVSVLNNVMVTKLRL
jgi:hypothetical protein